MQNEFDNTIDSLLRRTARRNEPDVLFEAHSSQHLDVDEIAAFAEHVLPAAARVRTAEHLANCNDCRQILATFALALEAENEEIAVTAPQIETATAAQTSWRERLIKLFAVPNLGYATAALVLLFFGIFAFIALRNKPEESSATVAQVQEETVEEKIAKEKARIARPINTPEPVAQTTPLPETPANTAETLPTDENVNTSAPSQTTSASSEASLPPSYRGTTGQTGNRNAATQARREPETPRPDAPNTASTNNASNSGTVALAPPTANKLPPDTQIVNQETTPNKPKPGSPQAADAGNANPQPGESAVTRSAVEEKLNTSRSAPAVTQTIEKRAVSSKTFSRQNGVWVDSAYTSQNVTVVSRNSDEFKKLDAALRSIAAQIGGEAIIVWQGKAFRIR